MSWVLGFYALAVAATGVAAWLLPSLHLSGRLEVFTTTPPLVLGAAFATVAVAWYRRDPAAAGWPGWRQSARGVGVGLVAGAGMAVAALLVAVVAGARWSIPGGDVGAYLVALVGVLAGIGLAALAEELLFRGFPLATLARAFGPVGAVSVLSVMFALLHARNPEVTPLGLGNILLASVVLSVAFLSRGALTAAWGLHASWNGGLVVADAPVSGIAFDLPAVHYGGGAAWMTGASFGPEGGVAASLALGGGLVWLVSRSRGEAREAAG